MYVCMYMHERMCDVFVVNLFADMLEQWFLTWGHDLHEGLLGFFRGVMRSSVFRSISCVQLFSTSLFYPKS